MSDSHAGGGTEPGSAASAPTGVTLQQLQDDHAGRLDRVLGRVDAALHLAATVTLLALLAWTVVDILGRTLLDRPLRGTVELTELAVVVLVYLGLGQVERQDAHISVDLLYVRLGRRGQLLLRLLAGVIGLAILSVMTWRLWVYAAGLDAGGYTSGILRLPLYPVALLGVAGALAFTLSVLANLSMVVRALIRSR